MYPSWRGADQPLIGAKEGGAAAGKKERGRSKLAAMAAKLKFFATPNER